MPVPMPVILALGTRNWHPAPQTGSNTLQFSLRSTLTGTGIGTGTRQHKPAPASGTLFAGWLWAATASALITTNRQRHPALYSPIDSDRHRLRHPTSQTGTGTRHFIRRLTLTSTGTWHHKQAPAPGNSKNRHRHQRSRSRYRHFGYARG